MILQRLRRVTPLWNGHLMTNLSCEANGIKMAVLFSRMMHFRTIHLLDNLSQQISLCSRSKDTRYSAVRGYLADYWHVRSKSTITPNLQHPTYPPMSAAYALTIGRGNLRINSDITLVPDSMVILSLLQEVSIRGDSAKINAYIPKNPAWNYRWLASRVP